MIKLTDYFDRVFVINLDCCPERWEKFEEVAAAAGITGYERYRAIHGDTCQHPAWWRCGNGAWGCLMSHFQIAQTALMDGLESYLVLEDDVVFSTDFSERFVELMKTLEGESWDQLYLGGQHLWRESSPPVPWREGIVRGRNINRTHAFAVHKRFMLKFYQHIMHAPDYLDSHKTWQHTDEQGKVHDHEFMNHIDHQLGVLHQRYEHNIIAANPWLCGQGANNSNINGQPQEEQWWHENGWYM